jgi:hypothetical protein
MPGFATILSMISESFICSNWLASEPLSGLVCGCARALPAHIHTPNDSITIMKEAFMVAQVKRREKGKEWANMAQTT